MVANSIQNLPAFVDSGQHSIVTAPADTGPSPRRHFTIAAPGWMAGLDGTVGLRGLHPDVDIDVDEILRHVDMIWGTRVDASKGPFGIYGEFIYGSLSDS